VKKVASGIIHQFQANDPLRREINLHLKNPRGEDWQFEWEYAVLQNNEVNAFCLPGGKIAVYTGLLKFVGDDDAKLATVLSHEIGHALAHHASERLAVDDAIPQAADRDGPLRVRRDAHVDVAAVHAAQEVSAGRDEDDTHGRAAADLLTAAVHRQLDRLLHPLSPSCSDKSTYQRLVSCRGGPVDSRTDSVTGISTDRSSRRKSVI